MSEEIFNIYTLVKETGAIIHASETEWCRVQSIVQGREWYYGFEDTKGQAALTRSYKSPLLHIELLENRIQVTLEQYTGRNHCDIFAFDRVLWRDAGGVEGRHVGNSLIVDLPEPPPPIEPVPAPPVVPTPPGVPTPPIMPAPVELKPLTDRLDALLSVLRDVKSEIEALAVKSNTYSAITIDLSVERSDFELRPVNGQALTVFSCTGTMDIKIGAISTDPITIQPLAYPQMISIDKFDFDRFYVRNAAQPGRGAIIIVWRRE